MVDDPNTLARYEAFCADVVGRMTTCDPDTIAVVNTMRHQRRKRWSDIVRCFRRHIEALGVERQSNLGFSTFKARLDAHNKHCELIVTTLLLRDPVRRYRVRALRSRASSASWSDVALEHRQELIEEGIAKDNDFDPLTFDRSGGAL